MHVAMTADPALLYCRPPLRTKPGYEGFACANGTVSGSAPNQPRRTQANFLLSFPLSS